MRSTEGQKDGEGFCREGAERWGGLLWVGGGGGGGGGDG